MEHLNKIELVGTLWSISVQDYDTAKAGKLTVFTECEYSSKDGCKRRRIVTGGERTVHDIIASKVETL